VGLEQIGKFGQIGIDWERGITEERLEKLPEVKGTSSGRTGKELRGNLSFDITGKGTLFRCYVRGSTNTSHCEGLRTP